MRALFWRRSGFHVVHPITAGIREHRRYRFIDALLDVFNFIVRIIRRLDTTDIEFKILLHDPETMEREVEVVSRCYDVPFWILAPGEIAEKIDERCM